MAPNNSQLARALGRSWMARARQKMMRYNHKAMRTVLITLFIFAPCLFSNIVGCQSKEPLAMPEGWMYVPLWSVDTSPGVFQDAQSGVLVDSWLVSTPLHGKAGQWLRKERGFRIDSLTANSIRYEVARKGSLTGCEEFRAAIYFSSEPDTFWNLSSSSCTQRGKERILELLRTLTASSFGKPLGNALEVGKTNRQVITPSEADKIRPGQSWTYIYGHWRPQDVHPGAGSDTFEASFMYENVAPKDLFLVTFSKERTVISARKMTKSSFLRSLETQNWF